MGRELYYTDNCLEALCKTKKTISQNNRSPPEDLNTKQRRQPLDHNDIHLRVCYIVPLKMKAVSITALDLTVSSSEMSRSHVGCCDWVPVCSNDNDVKLNQAVGSTAIAHHRALQRAINLCCWRNEMFCFLRDEHLTVWSYGNATTWRELIIKTEDAYIRRHQHREISEPDERDFLK
jgi:hypothetical protein